MVKNLLAMQEAWVQSLSWEDPLEEEMAAHRSILAWTIPWAEEPGRLLCHVTKSQTRLSNSTAQHSKQGEKGENVVIREHQRKINTCHIALCS